MKKITNSELATILAALRYFQASKVTATGSHFDDAPPLTPEEIDELCETLNTEVTILDKSDRKSLKTLLDYSEPDEARSFEECDDRAVKKAHIYHHIRRLREGLED